MSTVSTRGRPSRGIRRAIAIAATASIVAGLLAVPLAATVTAKSPSVGHRSTATVVRVGPAYGFAGRPAQASLRVQSIGPSSLLNELAEDPEHERPGAASPGGPLPTNPPRVRANSLTSRNPGFRGFSGLNHFDQRSADGGNQFSLEPPDGAICAGSGRELEMVNNAIAVYDRSGHMVAGPVGVNEFFGYAPGIDRTTGAFGPFMGDIKCLFDPGTHRWFLSSFNLEQDPVSGDFTGHTSVDWAVSKTSNPAGGYTVFSIDTTNGDGTLPGHPGCPCLSDQPLIGVDAYGFYISTNEFSFFGPEFNNAQLYAISKTGLASAANGGAVPQATWFDQIPLAEGYSYSLQPASAPVNSGFERRNNGTAYFLSALDFNAAFDNRIAVWAITGTKTLGTSHPTPVLQSRVIRSQAYGQPPEADQAPGSTPLRDALAAGTPRRPRRERARGDRLQRRPDAVGRLRRRPAVGQPVDRRHVQQGRAGSCRGRLVRRPTVDPQRVAAGVDREAGLRHGEG